MDRLLLLLLLEIQLKVLLLQLTHPQIFVDAPHRVEEQTGLLLDVQCCLHPLAQLFGHCLPPVDNIQQSLLQSVDSLVVFGKERVEFFKNLPPFFITVLAFLGLETKVDSLAVKI
jgi:hypothetical protein